jgi:hypothetical protein
LPPHVPQIRVIRRTDRFEREIKALKPDILEAAKEAIKDLQKDPIPTSRRLHKLGGYKNPKVYTVDVLSNHSYKISLEIDGQTATLRRIATHKEIDRVA